MNIALSAGEKNSLFIIAFGMFCTFLFPPIPVYLSDGGTRGPVAGYSWRQPGDPPITSSYIQALY